MKLSLKSSLKAELAYSQLVPGRSSTDLVQFVQDWHVIPKVLNGLIISGGISVSNDTVVPTGPVAIPSNRKKVFDTNSRFAPKKVQLLNSSNMNNSAIIGSNPGHCDISRTHKSTSGHSILSSKSQHNPFFGSQIVGLKKGVPQHFPGLPVQKRELGNYWF